MGLSGRLRKMSTEKRLYILAELCIHLVENREVGKAAQLLTNPSFLAARCHEHGLDSILDDFRALREIAPNDWREHGLVIQFQQFLSKASNLLHAEPSILAQEALMTEEVAVVAAARHLRESEEFPGGLWLSKVSGVRTNQHTGPVISLAFLHDQNLLAVSTLREELWVWDLAGGVLDRRLQAPPSPAKSLAISPDGGCLAAGLGSHAPASTHSGVYVWDLTGGAITFAQLLPEFVYSLRWRNDREIIASAGLPRGSEATGSLWFIDAEAMTCSELGNWLTEQPILISWDVVDKSPLEVMAVDKDGHVLHLHPGYEEISESEAAELYTAIMIESLEQNDLEEIILPPTPAERRLAERRPVVADLPAISSDDYGYGSVAALIDSSNLFCFLGQPRVLPELRMLHGSPNPDGLYVLDRSTHQGMVVSFEKVDDQSIAICLAAAASKIIAVGDSYGRVILFDSGRFVRGMRVSNAPITSVCLSRDGSMVAIGTSGAEVFVCKTDTGEMIFSCSPPDGRPRRASISNMHKLVFHEDSVELSTFRRSDESQFVRPANADLVIVGCTSQCRNPCDVMETGRGPSA